MDIVQLVVKIMCLDLNFRGNARNMAFKTIIFFCSNWRNPNFKNFCDEENVGSR